MTLLKRPIIIFEVPDTDEANDVSVARVVVVPAGTDLATAAESTKYVIETAVENAVDGVFSVDLTPAIRTDDVYDVYVSFVDAVGHEGEAEVLANIAIDITPPPKPVKLSLSWV